MKSNRVVTALLLIASSQCFADSGESKVLSMLKTNPVVVAAVKQAKAFGPAKTCHYDIVSWPDEQLEKGSAYTYEAHITCKGTDEYGSSGMVTVSGTHHVSAGVAQALTVTVEFAD